MATIVRDDIILCLPTLRGREISIKIVKLGQTLSQFIVWRGRTAAVSGRGLGPGVEEAGRNG